MDTDEDDRDSGGLYDTSPDFAPDFLSDSSDEDSAKDRLRDSEEAATSGEDGLYERSRGKEKSDSKDDNGGGSGTQAGGLISRFGKSGDLPKIAGVSKFAIPIIVIVFVLIVVFAIFIFIGQGSFASSFKALEMEEHNTTTVSAAATTDNMINGVQLCGSQGSGYGDLAYADVGLSEEQIVDFEDAGFEYSEEEKTLSYKKSDGETVVITCDERVGKSKTGEAVADSGTLISDSGDTDYEAVKAEILANLDLSPEVAVVEGFSEAMEDATIKEKYMVATRSYRGNMATWFTPMADTMVARLGISRDFFKNFEKSGSNEEDMAEVEKIVGDRAHSVDTGESLEDRIEKIEAGSQKERDSSCGAISASNEIAGVTNATETYKQILISAMYLEAIDKTIAGYGTEAPQASLTNMLMETGAAGSEYMQDLFGGKTLEQNSETVKNISPQANELDANWSEDVNEETYRSCQYVANTISYENAGAVSGISSAFQGAWNEVIKFFKGLGGKGGDIGENGAVGEVTGALVSVLDPQVARFNQMKERKYFGTDVDGNVQGGGIGRAAEIYFGEHAKSEGQTVGSLEKTLAFRRAQQEVIAENAWYDQRTKSPFDTSSRHTFLGSIAYSMMPLAVSAPSLSLTSVMSTLGNMVSDSATALLPTSSAVSDAELLESIGDCVMQNSTTSIANTLCNPYYGSDLSLSGTTPIQAFESAASMRYDTEGTYIGGYAYDTEDNGKKVVSATGFYPVKDNKADIALREKTSDPMYMNGPVNAEEANFEHHWPEKFEEKLEAIGEDGEYEGEPRGCESNWYHETRRRWNSVLNGYEDYTYYNFDWPIEWTYSRGPTNFEYMGYQSGWPNILSNNTIGQELAENNAEPGECVLDFKVNDDKMPIINMNGALALYIIANGQRNSEYGVTDNENVKWLSQADFTQGRLHPCNLGDGIQLTEEDKEKYCQPYIDNWHWGVGYDPRFDDMESAVANSNVISRWVSGTAYTVSNGETDGVNVGTMVPNFAERFQDPTRNNENFWEEQKFYQNFIEKNEWMDSAGLIKEASPTYETVSRYYEMNPLDQSYEGIIARYSGKSKEQVVAVLDLLDYMEFLAQYDPTDLYPLAPAENEEIIYDDMTVVAEAEKAIMNYGIVYDEIRNRTVAA